MKDLPGLNPDDFAAFFSAIHGVNPFPWQTRLVRRIATHGWPGLLDLPTGTGKTAAIDIAVFALALEAQSPQRRAPIRIVYVVDRRTIVDQAYERAERLRQALLDSNDRVLRSVRERLAVYGDEGIPLQTALLRGGIARDDIWANAPDQPMVAVSTVDQVGSRLLFRGYGVTDSMKPVHAALLGCDVLYLLDEVHLSQPFRETLAAVGDRYRFWSERQIPHPFVVVEMSATPGVAKSDAFSLDEEDRQHPVLSVRLRSQKHASLVSTTPRHLLKEIEKHADRMLDRAGVTMAVVVNRVNVARDAHALLTATLGARADVHLLTGRMRPFDRDAVEGSLLQRIRAGRQRSSTDRATIIVATQTIEAGADFDFDDLITECASLDALRQRFGRLDRLGNLGGSARGVIIARTDSLRDDKVYGDAIGKTWSWLESVANNGSVDFGVEAFEVPADSVNLGLLAPRVHAPVLLPSHLDAWVQTSPMPVPDPDVALFLHGPKTAPADVQIMWRADLSEELLARALHDQVTEAFVVSTVDALPPVSAEAMSVSFIAAKCWLSGQSEPESFDVEGSADVEPDEKKTDSPSRAALVWQGEESRVVDVGRLRPGQTIVVPCSYGGMANRNWAPASREAVPDVGEVAALPYRGRPVWRLHPSVVRAQLDRDPPTPTADGETVDDRDSVWNWLEEVAPLAAERGLGGLVTRLLEAKRLLRVEREPLSASGDTEYFLVSGRRLNSRLARDVDHDLASSDDTRSSFTEVEVTLREHLAGVAEKATGFAHRLGLDSEIVDDLRLAANWHDAGKSDPRFQRWLHGGSEFKTLVQREPLAKSRSQLSGPAISRARERAGYPAGGRHELMSLALMEVVGEDLSAHAHDWSAVRHLVASHHGKCRPLPPWVADPQPVEVSFSTNGFWPRRSSAHDLARLDSGVAERFWFMIRAYGWWGAAFLETLLRLADHRQSERERNSRENRDA